jgi:hypothetical protein
MGVIWVIPIFFSQWIRDMTSQKIAKVDGVVKGCRCKARESLPAAGRLGNEAYREVRRNDEI